MKIAAVLRALVLALLAAALLHSAVWRDPPTSARPLRTGEARALLRRARAVLAPEGGARTRVVPTAADPAAAEYFRRLGRTP